ncbi:ParA family protein [Arundinibacter roseus]|uniref:ParA family protein n=1 Tax=Arundinibacter roseus TaxID=2070510 RepID=A0A4R4KKN8_9BACT|nr:ParA family protein [Arundinibacter roseus]TDB67566.1 ParA family protein [Arundinibacter roseus]
MLTNDDVVGILNQNPALSLSILEKEAGLPSSTLSKALAGRRILNEKHLSALTPVLSKYGFAHGFVRKARVIAVINHKGGVGKTTTTINLGKALALKKYRVLMVDMDSQGNLSQSLGIDEPDTQVVHTLLKNTPLITVPLGENYDLAPSDLELAYADLELVQAVGGVNQLRNALAPLLNRYDYILIDCPPALNIFTNSALVAADSCLITLQPEASAMKGVSNLFDRIFQVRDRINYTLKVEGVLLTMVDKRLKVHRDMIEYIKQTLADFRIFETDIRNNVAVKESQIAQQDIFTYAPQSNAAEDYMKLANELIQRN